MEDKSGPNLTASGLTTPLAGPSSVHALATVATSDKGNDEINDDISVEVTNSNNVSFPVHSKSIVQVETEISDLLDIINSNTNDISGVPPEDLIPGGALNVVKKDLALACRRLEQLQTSNGTAVTSGNPDNSGTQVGGSMILGSHTIGGLDTVDVLEQKVLRTNTLHNAVQSITVGNFDNLLTPVWKYSQHKKGLPSVSRMPTTFRDPPRP